MLMSLMFKGITRHHLFAGADTAELSKNLRNLLTHLQVEWTGRDTCLNRATCQFESNLHPLTLVGLLVAHIRLNQMTTQFPNLQSSAKLVKPTGQVCTYASARNASMQVSEVRPTKETGLNATLTGPPPPPPQGVTAVQMVQTRSGFPKYASAPRRGFQDVQQVLATCYDGTGSHLSIHLLAAC